MFAYVIFLLYICRKFIAMSETQFSQISEAQDMGITLQIAEGLQARLSILHVRWCDIPKAPSTPALRATACEMQEFIMVI